MSSAPQLTQLLIDWKNGDEQAISRLTPIIYDELRRLAAHYLNDEHAANTLQPTALVHEAYIRLVGQNMPDWECRSHFFGVAAHLMRQILVDDARRHRSAKRGDGGKKLNGKIFKKQDPDVIDSDLTVDYVVAVPFPPISPETRARVQPQVERERREGR